MTIDQLISPGDPLPSLRAAVKKCRERQKAMKGPRDREYFWQNPISVVLHFWIIIEENLCRRIRDIAKPDEIQEEDTFKFVGIPHTAFHNACLNAEVNPTEKYRDLYERHCLTHF